MRSFSVRSDKFVFSAIFIILFASTLWISSVNALPQQQTSLAVKITDPARGQQVAIGKNLTLSGTAIYNATSNCGVFVIVDGIRPYQKTTPIGQTGGNDYSKWKYTFAPAYAGTIIEGINRITAKLLCQASPANLTKFYSINVTGMNEIVPKHPVTTRNNTTALPATSNNLSYLFQPTPLINHLSFPTDSVTSSDSSDSGSRSGGHHSSFTSATSSDSNRGRHHHSSFTSVTSSDSSDSGSRSGGHHHSSYDKSYSYDKSSRHHRGYGGGGDGGGYGGGGDGGGYGGGGDGGGYGGGWGW